MSTTNGAAVGARMTPFTAGPIARARERLLSAVQSFAMPRGGGRPRSLDATPPVADPAASAVSAARRPAPSSIAGPLGVGAHRAAIHPGGRKLAAVAHYRAMADEIAQERRLSAAGLGTPASVAVGRRV